MPSKVMAIKLESRTSAPDEYACNQYTPHFIATKTTTITINTASMPTIRSGMVQLMPSILIELLSIFPSDKTRDSEP
jgi:hypothetical protein